MNNNLISIVIPVYNAQKTILDCLKHCLSQDYAGDYEIIVIDDGSSDDSAKIIKSFGEKIKYIFQENAGPARARNTGWKNSLGEIVIFTDSDCLVPENWLKKLLTGFESDEKIAVVQGSYDIANKGNLVAEIINFDIREKHKKMPKLIKNLASYNIAVKKGVLEEVDGFSTSFLAPSAEDTDLSYRIIKLGYKIAFVYDSQVAHYHTETLNKYLKEQSRHGYWRIKLYKDHPKMLTGDSYTGQNEMIQTIGSGLVFVNILLLILELIIFQSAYSGWVLLALIVIVYLTELPRCLKMVKIKKNLKYLAFVEVMFLRSLWRTGGFIRGLINYFRI